MISDEELLRQTAQAHRRARGAPKSVPGEAGEMLNGNSETNASDAWARFSREWMELAAEVKRRGLKQPDVQ